MLLPKKTKYRKVRIGKNDGNATRGNYIAFGDYATSELPLAKSRAHVRR
jgi:ribosomal protein L16/L10AE